MEKESDISLGGALNLHTLVALTIFVGEKRKNAEALKMCVGGGEGWKVCLWGEGGRERVEGR